MPEILRITNLNQYQNPSRIDRAVLASSLDTDTATLTTFCTRDRDPLVVRMAILNPRCHDADVHQALKRFPDLDTEELWQQRMKNIEDWLNDNLEEYNIKGDRDQIIYRHILKLDHANSHVMPDTVSVSPARNPVISWADTDRYRVAMVIAPSWGVLFPPYNLAKLTGLLRHRGYSVRVYDTNLESYHHIRSQLGQDFWRAERYYLWINQDNFYQFVFPYIRHLLDAVVKDIAESGARVAGFSLYNTNVHASTYMMFELRRLRPDICIIAGGPQAATSDLDLLPINYKFVGESEVNLVEFLDDLPETLARNEVIGGTNSRLVLDQFPYADYTDYNLKAYIHQHGVSMETSRGCVAQCSFCAETYFWKYRSMTPQRVVEEIVHQHRTYGVRRFWFVDSLVNGNLKNFQEMVDLIIESKIRIKWNSYARCDGRMTKDFLKRVKKSGCTTLSFGVESGSQKVLYDMRKKIELWEIENNLQDSRKVGIYNHVNWLIGFPTEQPIDYLHSLMLIFRTRKTIDAISPGFGAGPAHGSHMNTEWRTYGITGEHNVWDDKYLDGWRTENYDNTILHRFLRIKMFHIWLDVISKNTGGYIKNSQRYDTVRDFYDLKLQRSFKEQPGSQQGANRDDVDLNQFGRDRFSRKIANEYLALVFASWQIFGGFELTVKSDPDMDRKTFGTEITKSYTACFTAVVNPQGDYRITVSHKLDETQSVNNFDDRLEIQGNITDWMTGTNQVGETVHAQYRKNHIPIKSV